MTKTPRLSKSGIEYLDFQWGIFSGCHNWENGICPIKNCWAKSFAQRFKNIYPNGFEPTFYPEAINSPKYLKKPSIIGVGWVGDVVGYCGKVSERSAIYQTILQCPQHTFLFLTKNPGRLHRWSPFPSNCWAGITVTDGNSWVEANKWLNRIEAKVKFVSIEPLLGEIYSGVIHIDKRHWLDWLVIGLQTPYSSKTAPKIEHISKIVEAADKAGIPIFLKDNLKPLIEESILPATSPLWDKRFHGWKIRQEFPKEGKK